MENYIIDRSNIKNIWFVQLLPFCVEDKGNKNLVRDFQKFCKEKNIFGIGWSDDKKTGILADLFGSAKLNDEISESYQSEYKKIHQNMKEEINSLKTAINNCNKIKANDLIITRLRNGEFCIGRIVTDEIRFMSEKAEDKEDRNLAKEHNNILKKVNSQGVSWYGKVHKWHVYSKEELPADVIAKFSNSHGSKTLYSCGDYRINFFIIKKYMERFKEEDIKNNFEEISIPGIKLNKKNFARALNPDDLEDLVYLYIKGKDEYKNYVLLPSDCKKDEQKYECYLKEPNEPENVIAFQTKNQARLDCEDYKANNDKKLKEIFLYSGLGVDNRNCKPENVTIIEDSEKNDEGQMLYEILTHSSFFTKKISKSAFYEISDNNNLDRIENFKEKYDLSDWTEKEKGKRFSGNMRYRVNYNDDKSYFYSIQFKVKRGLIFYYYPDFDRFVIDNKENSVELKTLINKIVKNQKQGE